MGLLNAEYKTATKDLLPQIIKPDHDGFETSR